MAFIGTPLDTRNTFQSLVGKRFNGDGSTTAFTLDVAPSSTLDIEVFVGNVRQDPNSAYTLSGTTLTFTGAPPSGTNNIYVVHQAKSVGTIGIPDDTISARTLVTADSSADHVLIEDATDGELKKALYPSGFDVSSITGATALTVEPATTDEIVISDAGTLKRMDLSLLMGQPSFFAVADGNQGSIANNTWTKINLGSEIFDAGGTFASSRFTPGIAGFYIIHFGCYIANIDDGERVEVKLYKNGSEYTYGAHKHYSSLANADGMITSSTCVQMDDDDYIELYANHNEGASETAYASRTYMFGYKTLGTL